MIQDCSLEKSIVCDENPSCEYVNATARLFINKTFARWDNNYNFKVEMGDYELIINNSCGEGDNRKNAFQPISLYPFPGYAYVNIDICEW